MFIRCRKEIGVFGPPVDFENIKCPNKFVDCRQTGNYPQTGLRLMGSTEITFQDVRKSLLAMPEFRASDRIAFAERHPRNRTVQVSCGEKRSSGTPGLSQAHAEVTGSRQLLSKFLELKPSPREALHSIKDQSHSISICAQPRSPHFVFAQYSRTLDHELRSLFIE
jgi:hypothetical protein